jgi:hypothetical protein
VVSCEFAIGRSNGSYACARHLREAVEQIGEACRLPPWAFAQFEFVNLFVTSARALP